MEEDMGWTWISLGQLLRESKKLDVEKIMASGELVDTETSNEIMADAILAAEALGKDVAVDGYPRQVEQAKFLAKKGLLPNLVVVLKAPETELLRRISQRGRADDADESVVKNRMRVFFDEIDKISRFFEENGVRFAQIDGDRSIEEVHEKIVQLLEP